MTMSLISLVITVLLLLYLCIFIYKSKQRTQIKYAFFYTLSCLLIWCIGLIAQILLVKNII